MEGSVKFQLIYSDGSNGSGTESFWEFYSIALVPFALGASASCVDLLVAERYLNYNTSFLLSEESAINRNSQESMQYLPRDYGKYFQEVYQNARSISRGQPEIKAKVSVRIISGHGFSSFDGGKIKCGTENVMFADILPMASHLTILDICNAAYAVAGFTGTFPTEAKKFTGSYRKKHVFKKPPLMPVACDTNSATWTFRIGVEGQHEQAELDLELDVARMSRPIGDSVSASVLAACQAYVAHDKGENLTELFLAKYTQLKTVYLENYVAKPFADLGPLQELLDTGSLQLNHVAFDSIMFQLQNEWFLTTERATQLLSDQENMAREIVGFIVHWLCDWYANNPEAARSVPEAEKAWSNIALMMGPFRRLLQDVYLKQQDDVTGAVFFTVSTEGDGVAIENYAVACETLHQCERRVQIKILTGSFETEDLEE